MGSAATDLRAGHCRARAAYTAVPRGPIWGLVEASPGCSHDRGYTVNTFAVDFSHRHYAI